MPEPVTYGPLLPADDPRWLTSAFAFEETVRQLEAAIDAAGLWLVHTIDPQVLLKRGGYEIPRVRQLLFFHPRFMARLLAANPAGVVEAPLKLVVLELPGGLVRVRTPEPRLAFARHPGLGGLGSELQVLTDTIATSIGSPAVVEPARASAIRIRRLEAADAAAYNAFFTDGTRAHPDSLRITGGDIAASPFSTEPTPEATTFAAIAKDADAWLGVVSVERERGREKRRHIAWLVRMYVAGSSAGQGVGRALLRAAVARARELPGVSKVNLTVAASNDRAIQLYQAEGFRTFSREPDAFRNDRHPVDELTMSLTLAPLD